MNANEGTLTELYAFSMAISCLIYKIDYKHCKLNVTTIRDECSGVELG